MKIQKAIMLDEDINKWLKMVSAITNKNVSHIVCALVYNAAGLSTQEYLQIIDNYSRNRTIIEKVSQKL